MFNEKLIPILHKSFPNIEETTPNSFYEASIILILISEITKQENYWPTPLTKKDTKNLNRILAKSNLAICKKRLYTTIKWELLEECKVDLTSKINTMHQYPQE